MPSTNNNDLPEFRELSDLEKEALLAQIPLVRRFAFCVGVIAVVMGLALFGYFWTHHVRTDGHELLWIGGGALATTLLIAANFFFTAFAPAYGRSGVSWPKVGRYQGTLQVAGKPAHYIFGTHPVNLQRGWAGIPLFEKLEGEMTPPVGHLRRFEQRHQMLTVSADDGRMWSLHEDAAAGKVPLKRTGWFSDPNRRWY